MGTKANLQERDERYRRIRNAMAAAGLDALVVAGSGGHFSGDWDFRWRVR